MPSEYPASKPVDAAGPSGAPQKGTRRAHRKSRNGCLTCKRRKIKCDEAKPSCANCIQFEVLCDFSSGTVPFATSNAPSRSPTPGPGPSLAVGRPSLSPPRRRGRGRPRRDWSVPVTPPNPLLTSHMSSISSMSGTSNISLGNMSHSGYTPASDADSPATVNTAHTVNTASSMHSQAHSAHSIHSVHSVHSVHSTHSAPSYLYPPPVPSSGPLPSSCELNVADAELLFQFTSSTAISLAGSSDGGKYMAEVDMNNPIVKFWTRNVPRIGLEHHYVLHLTYAVAAYHLAYLETANAKAKDKERETLKSTPNTPGSNSYTSIHAEGFGAESSSDAKRQYYVSLAERHVSAGLSEFTRLLPTLNDSNCGALYMAATLVCYYAFAAGPTGPSDFLICRDSDTRAPFGSQTGNDINDSIERLQWVSLIHGVRLIRWAVAPEILFSGLLAPLGPGIPGRPDRQLSSRGRRKKRRERERQRQAHSQGLARSPVDDDMHTDDEIEDILLSEQERKAIEERELRESMPLYMERKLPRLDWEDAFASLRQLIASFNGVPAIDANIVLGKDAGPGLRVNTDLNTATDVDIYLNRLSTLEDIYAATYGRNNEAYTSHPADRIVFTWLYRLDDWFVAHIRQKEPLPLLIFAYFAVLLETTMSREWFMEGWAKHIILTVRGFIDEKYAAWLRWPMQQIGLELV